MALTRPGPRNLITDVSGLAVGNAADPVLKSGVTVLTGDRPFTAAVDVRGGAPGTRETDLLAPDKLVSEVHALVLAGGSVFGLNAASGVADALRDAGTGLALAGTHVPVVPAAILFDLGNGGQKTWTQNPYNALGRAALAAAAPGFEIGTAGAGTGALAGRLKGGLGSASAVLEGSVTVGALVAANPIGCVTYPGSRHFLAAHLEEGAEFGGLDLPDAPEPLTLDDIKRPALATNTTLAIVATDAKLDKAGAQRMAVAAQDGMARAIRPAHTPFDGDIVFAVSTGTGPEPDRLQTMLLGHAAADCLARAIARAVHAATPMPGDLHPCWRDMPPRV